MIGGFASIRGADSQDEARVKRRNCFALRAGFKICQPNIAGLRRHRLVDQRNVIHGTWPLYPLYFDLKPQPSNLGAVGYVALQQAGCEPLPAIPRAIFRLFRIRDAAVALHPCRDL
jgi:hypothetical protein